MQAGKWTHDNSLQDGEGLFIHYQYKVEAYIGAAPWKISELPIPAKEHPLTGETDKCLQKGHNMGILAQDRKGKKKGKGKKVSWVIKLESTDNQLPEINYGLTINLLSCWIHWNQYLGFS